MRDFNFFDPFIEKREYTFDKMIILYLILIIALLRILGNGGLNLIKIASLNKEVSALSSVVGGPETTEKIDEIKILIEEVETFKMEVDQYKYIDESIARQNVINYELLININSKLPKGVFLNNMSIKDSQVQMSGFAEDKFSIAEFMQGISELEVVEDVFISNISEVEDYYNYNLEILFKGVTVDED